MANSSANTGEMEALKINSAVKTFLDVIGLINVMPELGSVKVTVLTQLPMELLEEDCERG